MIPSSVYGRYARALVDVVLEMGQEEQISREMATYREIFRSTPDLIEALDSPAVPRESKGRILDELVRLYPVGKTMANFLRVLLQHNRLRCFQEICDAYGRLVNERKGILSAEVTAAAPLSQENVARLRESLSKTTGKSVRLEVSTDPSLLGGLVVRVGSTVYDGSIRKQLEQMRQKLQEA